MELLDAMLQERRAEAEAALAGRGLRRARAACDNLRRMFARVTPPEFGELIARLEEILPENPDPDRALNNLERYQAVTTGTLRPHPLSRDRPALFKLLLDLLGASQFAAEVLCRHPHYVWWIGEPETLNEAIAPEALEAELRDALAQHETHEQRQQAATIWHRRHLIRACARVIEGRTDETEFMREISELAVCLVRAATDEALHRMEQRHGAPMEEDPEDGISPRRAGFAVAALGKLGGMELNFSSDIDLVFVYSAEGRTAGVVESEGGEPVRRATNHAFFCRVAETIVKFLSAATSEGFMFRVDTRLRPDGAEGPLARSLDAFEIYHETQARPWERMALIRGRAIAGDPGLCRRFDALSRGLVFGQRVGPEILRHVRDLKIMIDDRVRQSPEGRREIKRGRGGIREIEFVVQTLQLMHGFDRPALQTRSLPEAIRALADAGKLDPDEAEQAIDDYLFLRRVENRLQMLELRRTHTLPVDEAELDALARRCGLAAEAEGSPGEELMRRWTEISDRINARFSEFFEMDAEPAADERPPAERAATLILGGAPEKDLIPLLEPMGLGSPTAIQSLKRLGGLGRSTYLDRRGREIYGEILPHLMQTAAAAARPGPALVQLESFLTAYGSFAALYEIFRAHPKVLELILRTFGMAQSFAKTLIAHPEYADYLLDPVYLSRAPERGEMLETLERWLGGRPWSEIDDEAFAAALARLRRLRFTLTGFAECGGLVGAREAAVRLSDAAEAVLEAALRRAIARKGSAREEGAPRGFGIVALGKLGTRELNYYSDLDIIFCWDETMQSAGFNEQLCGEAAASVVAAITTKTERGAAFNMDARLRPEGAGAPLAPPLERYVDYYGSRAQLWEFQSMMKARPAAGDLETGRRLIDALAPIMIERLEAWKREGAVARSIAEMRERIERSVKTPKWVLCDFKKSPGGVIDLEFLAQYFQLAHLKDDADLIGLRADEVFERMAGRGILDLGEARGMQNDYAFLRLLESRARLLFETERSHVPSGGEKLEALERAAADLLPEGAGALRDYLPEVMRRNRRRFDRILKADGA